MTASCVGSAALPACRPSLPFLSSATPPILRSSSPTLLPRRIHAVPSPARRSASHRRTPFLQHRSFPNPLFAPLRRSRSPPLRASGQDEAAPLDDPASEGGKQQPAEVAKPRAGGDSPSGALNGTGRAAAAGGGAAGSWGEGRKGDASGGWGDPSDLDQSRSAAGRQAGLPEFAAGFVLLLGLGALAFAGFHKRVSSAGRASAPEPAASAVVSTLVPSTATPPAAAAPGHAASSPCVTATEAAADGKQQHGSVGRGDERRGEEGREAAEGVSGDVSLNESSLNDPSLNDLLLPSQIVAAATVAPHTPPPLPVPIALSHHTTTDAAAAAAAGSEATGKQAEHKEGSLPATGAKDESAGGSAASSSSEKRSEETQSGRSRTEEADGEQQRLEQLLSLRREGDGVMEEDQGKLASDSEAGKGLSAIGGGSEDVEEEGEDVVGPFAAEVAASVSELRPWLEALEEQRHEGQGHALEGKGVGQGSKAVGEKASEQGAEEEGSGRGRDGAERIVSDSAMASTHPPPVPAAAAATSGADSSGAAGAMPWGMTVFVPAPLSASPPAAGGGGEMMGGQAVVVRAAVDSCQHTAMEALQALEVIEEGVEASEICSRREFARWLVHASNLLSRTPSDRIYPAMYVHGTTALAFDDLAPSDPDFPYIQGLAEAGLISSNLSHADLGCPRAASSAAAAAVAAARRRGCSPGASALFHPDCALTRQDLISWKLSLDYHNMMPLQPKEEVVAAVGFIDAERVHEDALPAIAQDVLRGDRSIIAAAFGFTRRFDPHKPVTRGQAAVALAGGGVSEVVAGEMARVEAEHIAEAAMAVVQEEAAAAAAAEAAMIAAKEEVVAGERRRREAAEKAAEGAVARVEGLQAELAREKEELEQQRQVLTGMREDARREKEESDAAVEQQRKQVEEQIGLVQQERHTAQQALADARAAAAVAAEAAEELQVEKQQLEAKRHATEQQAQVVQEAAQELHRARLQLQRRLQKAGEVGGRGAVNSMGNAGTGVDAGGGTNGNTAVEGTEEERQLLERVAEILARKQAEESEAGSGSGSGWSVDGAVSRARQLLQQAVKQLKGAGQVVPRDASVLAHLLQQQARYTLENARSAVGVALQRSKGAGEELGGGLVGKVKEMGKHFTDNQKATGEASGVRTDQAPDANQTGMVGGAGRRVSGMVDEAMHVGERLVEGMKTGAQETAQQAKKAVNELMEKWSKGGPDV